MDDLVITEVAADYCCVASRSGQVVRTLIPKIAEGIFDVIAVFTRTNEYVLYYHSGRKTIRLFRRKDGGQIANYRVSAELRCLETTQDGRSLGQCSVVWCLVT